LENPAFLLREHITQKSTLGFAWTEGVVLLRFQNGFSAKAVPPISATASIIRLFSFSFNHPTGIQLVLLPAIPRTTNQSLALDGLDVNPEHGRMQILKGEP